MSPNAGRGCGVSISTAVHRRPKKLGDLTPYLIYGAIPGRVLKRTVFSECLYAVKKTYKIKNELNVYLYITNCWLHSFTWESKGAVRAVWGGGH
jgi:hypothetical protein